MPDIKLRDSSGVENTYEGVDTITLPLADGSGTWTFGLTDEELKLDRYNNQYLFTAGPNNALWSKYIDRIDASDVGNLKHCFYGYMGDDLDKVEITFNNQGENNVGLYTYYAFGNALNITKLPTINNFIIQANMSNTFYECGHIENVDNFLNSIEKIGYYYFTEAGGMGSASSVSFNSMFNSCYRLKSLNLQHINDLCQQEIIGISKTSTPSFSSWINYCDELKSVTNIPVFSANNGYTFTSNFLGNGYFGNNNGMLTHLTFATDNGEPYKANWKSQTLDLGNSSSNGPGWETQNYNSVMTMYADYYNIADASDSSATLEGTQARYRAKKDAGDDDWCCFCGSKQVTYDGKSLYLSELFSRFNHDSAVELINSLPDTSEYLATAGGTNTIKFHGYSGALTDEGAINTLTPAEIQVATDKGWTITFVN